jgi:polyisoprenoid-binding protein YceI
MRGRSTVRILLGVGALAVVGFVAAYFLLFSDESPPPLTLADAPGTQGTTGESTPAAGGSTSELAGVWNVASGSEAGYRVREKLAALPAQSDAVGRTSAVTGQVQVEATGGAVTASDARFEVDLTTLRSDDNRRDNRIRMQGLESNRFPKATFVAAEPIRLAGDPPDGELVKLNAVGDLTLHGVTKRVTIPLEARLAGGQIQVAGALRFPMTDFSIEPPSIGGFVTVEPDATLEFRLNLQKG